MRYYLNRNIQKNGDHEVHKENCIFYVLHKSGSNFEYIGTFINEIDAIICARKKHPDLKIDGCYYCCKSTHTR